ncbi:MAG: sensor histidine kinase [Cytophagales bacterium]|nr:sensor histidine kinase [Cytophagales bacterium]
MNKKLVLWLLLLLTGYYGCCQWEPNRQAFFKHLKNFRFEAAKKEVEEVTDTNWNTAISLLYKTIYEAGQIPDYDWKQDSIKIRNLELSFPHNSEAHVVIKILLGYHFLYSYPYSKYPMEYFTDAYLLAKQIGTEEEKKFSIYSILKLRSWELNQTNDDLLLYLEIYRGLEIDQSDEFHLRMFEFKHGMRKLNHEVEIEDPFVDAFADLMVSFEPEHHFWTDYYIIRGVYLRHKGRVERNDSLTSEAENLFHLALTRMNDEPFLRFFQFRTYIQLSEVERVRRNYGRAIDYVNKAKEFSYYNDKLRAEFWLHRYVAPNLFGVGKKDSAFYVLSKADSFKKNLDALDNSLLISELTSKFETEEKEKQILLEREGKAQSRAIAIVLGITLILGLIISALVYRDSKRKRLLAIQDKNIQSEKVTNLLKEQELIALNSMIEGQEQERKRIAEDLHDRLGSTLSAVKMHMEVLSENDTRYDKINRIVDKAVNDTREIAHNMLSGVLTNFGLMAALQDLKESLESSNQFKVNLRSIQFDERLDSETEIHIYRIVQELISNTLKHAKATQVDLELKRTTDKGLIITYKDNGKGFDPETAAEGMGLKNIKNRIGKLEGHSSLTTAPMKGVQMIIELWKIT